MKVYIQGACMADISRRNILKAGLITPAVLSSITVDDLFAQENTSTVYMTKDLRDRKSVV